MDPLLLAGLVQGLVPFGLDAIFGGSKDVTGAQNDYLKKLSDKTARLKNDAGKRTSDSLFYKTTTSLLDQKYDEDLKRQQGINAQMGATNESELATLDQRYRARNDANVKTLNLVDQKRPELLDNANKGTLDLDKLNVKRAIHTQQNLSGLGRLFGSAVKGSRLTS